MQRMDSLDSSKGKISFKKRIHRPWKPALLESDEAFFPQIENAPHVLELNAILEDANTNLIREELQKSLEESARKHSINEEALKAKENRITIGGFLSPKNVLSSNQEERLVNTDIISELKNKEQEILLLAHDLKVANALEQLEKLELARKKEEEARKAAEEKALYAIHQAKIAAEQTYKAEQQLNVEKQSRIKEEKLRQFLEDKVQLALQEVEKKNQVVLKEEQARLNAEEKMKRALDYAANTEKRVLDEAEAKISKIVNSIAEKIKKTKQFSEETMRHASQKIKLSQEQAEEKIKQAQAQGEERIKQIQVQADEKIKFIQTQVDKKVQEAQEQAHFHEKAKLTAQAWAQKYIETARQMEAAKKEVEKKLDLSNQKINELMEKISRFDAEKLAIINEKSLVEEQLGKAFDNIKRMETIVSTEKGLRKILEEKLSDSQIRRDEQKRKLAEDKILELARQIGDLEVQKSKMEEKLVETNENLHKIEILMDSEKTIRVSLEDNIKEFIEKVNKLEHLKQKESDARHLAEQKILVLLSQKTHLEHEKTQMMERLNKIIERSKELEMKYESEKCLRKTTERSAEQRVTVLLNQNELMEQEKKQSEEKLHKAIERSKELEIMLESEKYLRKEAERLKLLEEQAKKAAQEKISHAIEQANKTVLNVLGNFSMTDPSNGGT